MVCLTSGSPGAIVSKSAYKADINSHSSFLPVASDPAIEEALLSAEGRLIQCELPHFKVIIYNVSWAAVTWSLRDRGHFARV